MKRNQHFFLALGFLVTTQAVKAGEGANHGPQTEPFASAQYATTYYVDINKGTESGNGTRQSPWKSLATALQHSVAAGQKRTAILVAQGSYAEGLLSLKEKVDLFGGFDAVDWHRDVLQFRTIINGEGKKELFLGANDARIDGFVLTNGSVLGNGGAILCKGVSPTITNNVFSNNKTLKPANWQPKYLHLTANDGGAVYGENGAAPVIRNNLFINNTTENGRGAAIGFNNKCKPVIEYNVFINNRAGLDDPMRSSDGGAIAVFNWCNATIGNNIFLSNKALARNDAGAVFVALWSSARISKNIIVDSESGDDAGAIFVGGQEHRYDGPLDPIPPTGQFYVTIDHNQLFGNRNSSMNSGAMRFTMEARGEFTNNVSAFNGGIYFQRSEVGVKNNLILDNFLFIETKAGLKQGSIENNFIAGEFRLETPARVENNWLRDGYDGGTNNRAGLPKIKTDGSSITAISANFNKSEFATDMLLTQSFSKNSLVNRVVRSGDRWGIVRSNDGSHITLWGDLNGISNLTLLPTYTLAQK